MSVDGLKWSGVMHVFASLGRGGAELRTWELVQATAGYRFGFLAATGEYGVLDDEVCSAGHSVTRVRVRSPRGILEAARALKIQEVKVLHSHLGQASGPVLIAALIARVPVRIVHFRSDKVGGHDSLLKSFYLTISRLIVWLVATDLVAVSPSSLEGSGLMWGRWRSRGRVIANGLDANKLSERANQGRARRRSTPQERLIVANVARREPSKNRARAIRIWSELARTRTTTLKLIGPMTDEELGLATRASEDSRVIASASRVEIIGETSQVVEHLGECDILLVTSSREGLPGVVLEALASGAAVVATRLPGIEWIDAETQEISMLSLKDPNARWVAELLTIPLDRELIQASFRQSRFQISHALAAHHELWGIPTTKIGKL